MNAHPVDRDERTVAVENASYRWAYLVLSFGLLVIVMYRSFAWRESAWDLLGLVVAGGIVPLLYQSSNHILSTRSAMKLLVAAVVGGLLAGCMILLRQA
ncbi:MAG TPA: hypothetical protein VL882_04870 [Vicinamibacterales bacterium]|jgi:hypothetical protein|nr:hypothetical protein [Vicinamibacterales bacterium]